MTFKEYINQKEPTRQEIGSVKLQKNDFFKIEFKTERNPYTDKKFIEIYFLIKIKDQIFTYNTTENGILKNPKIFKLSVFSIDPELKKELLKKYFPYVPSITDSIINDIKNKIITKEEAAGEIAAANLTPFIDLDYINKLLTERGLNPENYI